MIGLQELSEPERKHHLRNLAKTDLYYLIRYILNRKDIEKPWLFERCKEVQDAPDGYLDLWAREHYKSSLITFGKTIQDILINPEITIGIFSHTRPNAKGFLRQIKQEFETNKVLLEIFDDIFYGNPQRESPKWSEDEGVTVKRNSNPKEATIEAWGIVDGQPTGKHFKLCVYDDVVTRESVTSPDMIAKTTAALELSYNLGAEGGAMRFIGTRYHYNDSYRTLIDRGTAKPRIYPATEDGTVTGVPVLLTKERLAEKRRDQGPYTFACQMLQDPKADETQGFREDWLRYYDSVNLKGLNIYILCDPANGKKKDNDYTCGWAVGLGGDQKIRILDIVRDRLNLPQRTDMVFRWHRKYKPMRQDGVRYEQYGKDADIQHIEQKQIEENYTFDITAVGGRTPKNDRIKRLIPYFEQGRILLPRTLNYTNYQGQTRDLVNDFIQEEYKPFPVSLHDDMMDALARLLEPDYPLIFPKEQVEQAPMPNYGLSTTSWMG